MSRFAIFSIILVISLVTIFADLSIREYFDEGQASVLEPDPPEQSVKGEEKKFSPAEEREEPQSDGPQTGTAPQPNQPIPLQPSPLQPIALLPVSSRTVLEEILVRNAGFSGIFSEEVFSGKVYQLLDVTDHPVEAIGHYQIADEQETPVVTITEMVLRDEIKSLQLYTLLQNKTKPYIDLSLNETNAYGDRSFYINHAKKPNEAFLTVKIRNRLYAIAYVKSYHPQIKALIQILHG